MYCSILRSHSDPADRNTTDLAIPPAQGLHPPKLTTPKDPSGAVKGRSGQPSLHTGVGGEGSTEGRMLTTRDLVEATAAKLVRILTGTVPDTCIGSKKIFKTDELRALGY